VMLVESEEAAEHGGGNHEIHETHEKESRFEK
jgi:hypothetical protein